MVRMRSERLPEFVVALIARLVALHPGCELVVRSTLVHRMTRKTRHVAALKTRRLNDTIIFASGDAHHSIRPKTPIKQLWVLADRFGNANVARHSGQPNERRIFVKDRSRPVTKAPGHPRSLVIDMSNTVTLPANF